MITVGVVDTASLALTLIWRRHGGLLILLLVWPSRGRLKQISADFRCTPSPIALITYLSTFYGTMAKLGVLVILLPTVVKYSFAKSQRIDNIYGENGLVDDVFFHLLH
jgi:hypothetical protein